MVTSQYGDVSLPSIFLYALTTYSATTTTPHAKNDYENS